jgi:hypothetical protein
MKHKKLILAGIVFAGILFLEKSDFSFWDCSLLFFPFLLGHTLWIQSSAGYNILPGRTTSIFFGWGHHLPVHDPINLLGVQWTKEFQIYEPDGDVIHKDLGAHLPEILGMDQGYFYRWETKWRGPETSWSANGNYAGQESYGI